MAHEMSLGRLTWRKRDGWTRCLILSQTSPQPRIVVALDKCRVYLSCIPVHPPIGGPNWIQSSYSILLGERGRKGFAEAFTFPGFRAHGLMMC